MFDTISNFFEWFSQFINQVGEILKSMLHGLTTMFKLIPQIFTLTTDAISYVPSIFAVFIGLTIVILIVYIILGRESGSS